MSIKLELTKRFLEDANITTTDKELKKYFLNIWKNPRHEGERSLRLTDKGYEFLSNKSLLKFYKIDFPNLVTLTNQSIVNLDKLIDCPYYITEDSIYVSREKLAVQLILYGGDILKFLNAKVKSTENHLDFI